VTPRTRLPTRAPAKACDLCRKPFKPRALRYLLTAGRVGCETCLSVPRRQPFV
jgi:hypothetical protein